MGVDYPLLDGVCKWAVTLLRGNRLFEC